jgi:outer membrane biosynthesis protein TonB
MSGPNAARLARRLFGSVRREAPSEDLRARILMLGRAELERARGERAERAPDEVSELASTRRRRTRGRRWAALTAFVATAAGLVAYLNAARPVDQNILISAEHKPPQNPTPSTQPKTPTPIPTPTPTPTPIQTPTPTPTPIQTPIQTHSLSDELAQIKRARTALRAGDARRALDLLDAYRASPTGGELAAEASLLRIEALALSGQRDAAAREARQFASAYPNSPLIDRALGFVGGAK